MKVMVDGFNLALEKGTGIATYSRNLTRNIKSLGSEVHVLYGSRAAPAKTELMREIAFFDDNVEKPSRIGKRISIITSLVNSLLKPLPAYEVSTSGFVIRDQFRSRMPSFDKLWNIPYVFSAGEAYYTLLRRRLAVSIPARPEIAHWTYPLPLKVSGAKNIYTIHDLIPIRLPFTTLDQKKKYLQLVTRIAEKADHIVTVSETSKKDIINILGVNESRVTNTYQSVEIPQAYLDTSDTVLADELEGGFRLKRGGYLLSYGAIEPKKNLARVIDAYLAADLDIPLVIAGAAGAKAEQELKGIIDEVVRSEEHVGSETRIRRRIIRFEYVTFPQLVNLIRGAVAVLFPSLYEGFGLPILEGMICGTPVVTSKIGSMLEIAGEGSVLVDPYDVRDIKNAILTIATDAELRQIKIAQGFKVAEQYSAERYQQRLSSLYRRL